MKPTRRALLRGGSALAALSFVGCADKGDDSATLDEKIQSARDALRAVLEDEIGNANALASNNTPAIDTNAADAGRQALRSVLDDEVVDAVAKATAASPDAAVALSSLPELPSLSMPSLAGFNPAYLLAGLVGGVGGGGVGGLVSQATGVKVAGFVIDGYVSGATVFADLNGFDVTIISIPTLDTR
jgi:hypothetical protein